MTRTQADPARTYALVVGVEKYDAGTQWNLDGPASDAHRFVAWLRSHNVPDDNIALFLSCLDENVGIKGEPGLEAQLPTREHIEKFITERLPGQKCDLFYFFWVGHGIITVDGTRRLFYADATQANKSNLNLNSLLTSLRTSYFPGLSKQVLLIDACANYVEELRLPVTLPNGELPKGSPKPDHEQFVLLGAKAGETGRNVAARKTDLFSEEVLKALGELSQANWPPDMTKLKDQVVDRFSALRESGQASQTPIYFWYRDWDSGEGSFSQAQRGGSNPKQPSPSRSGPLSFQQQGEIVNALLGCPTMRDHNRHDTVLGSLRPEIANAVPRSPVDKADVFNITQTCLNYAGGLRELAEVVHFYEGDSVPYRALEAVLDRLLP